MITDIRLQNFRSYQDASFEFDEGVNIIVGPNASGKTNIIEAILFSQRGVSYRASDKDLIKHGQEWARIDCGDTKDKRIVKLLQQPGGRTKKSFSINNKETAKLAFLDKKPIVLFEPNNLNMLSGSPERRRDYLDDILEQTLPTFGSLRRSYKRVLAQRNALLKQSGNINDNLFVWNLRLCELAGQLYILRKNLTDDINGVASTYYSDFTHHSIAMEVSYSSNLNADNYSSDMLKKLELDVALDRARGFTGFGPHRDDMAVLLNKKPLGEHASRGETRTTMLVLKKIETEIIDKFLGQKPILLLDDVFSELDGSRRKALTENLKGFQCFITTTDADVVVHHFMDNTNIIPLSN